MNQRSETVFREFLGACIDTALTRAPGGEAKDQSFISRKSSHLLTPLILDVLCYASHCGFCCEEIAGTIDGDPLSHGSLGRISLVRRHEDGHLAVLQAPNANALEPAWMPLWIRFRVCSINHVASVYRQPAHPAEFAPCTEIPPFLRQDLNSVVVPVGDDQPSLGVELNRVWCSELPWPGSSLTDDPQELTVSVEHRDTANKIRILDVGMVLGDVYIVAARVHDLVGLGALL